MNKINECILHNISSVELQENLWSWHGDSGFTAMNRLSLNQALQRCRIALTPFTVHRKLMKSCCLHGHTQSRLELRVLISSGGVNCDHKIDHASRYVEEVDQFLEEPCGLTAEQGFGYAQPQIGEHVGIGRTYDHEILRKVGWGMYSSVWLAKDYRRVHYHSIGSRAITIVLFLVTTALSQSRS